MKRGLTISTAASVAELSRRWLQKILCARVAVGLDVLERIANRLGVPAAALLEELPEPLDWVAPPGDSLRQILARNIRRAHFGHPLDVSAVALRAGLGETTLYDVLACRVSVATDRLAPLALALFTTTTRLLDIAADTTRPSSAPHPS